MAFDKSSLKDTHRRKERIELDGGPVWVWEETAAEHLHKLAMAERPGIDSRGGIDIGTALVWQILYCLYDGDEPDARRVFDESELPLIYRFRRSEFNKITAAMAKVNGETREEEEHWEAFTRASEVAETSR